MIGHSVDAEGDAADFADDTPKISVKIGWHLRVDQRLSMMGLKMKWLNTFVAV
jgi:hypothetical protein